jgi:hypothetical protein
VHDAFLDFLRHEGFWAVVQEMPALAVLTELLRVGYPNVRKAWKMNDYNDLRFLSVALAYCSAVCCDRDMGAPARRSQYISTRGAISTGRDANASALDEMAGGDTTL